MGAKNPETRPAALFPESSFTYNPLMHVRVLLVRFVQGLFAQAPEGSYRWQPDDENTEIYITDESVVQPTVVEKVPAVTFTRGPIQFYSLGMDDLEQYDFALDRKTKGVLIPGTMTVNVCARVDLESEHIAFIIADHFWLLRDLLMRSGFFDIARGIQVGSPSPAGSVIAQDRGDEFSVTPISIPFQFARLSSFTPLGKDIVNSIEQTLSLSTTVPQFGLGSPGNTASHEVPQAVYYCPPEPFAPNAIDLQRSGLSMQPHPLNPAVQVRVRTIRPNRTGLKQHPDGSSTIPIDRPCEEQSRIAFEQKG